MLELLFVCPSLNMNKTNKSLNVYQITLFKFKFRYG